MKNIKCAYETQETTKTDLSKPLFLKNVKQFFELNSKMEDNETFYVLKAYIDKDGKVKSHGIYYGAKSTPLEFIITSDESYEKIVLTESLCEKDGYRFKQKIVERIEQLFKPFQN